jgi:hypothetical protein
MWFKPIFAGDSYPVAKQRSKPHQALILYLSNIKHHIQTIILPQGYVRMLLPAGGPRRFPPVEVSFFLWQSETIEAKPDLHSDDSVPFGSPWNKETNYIHKVYHNMYSNKVHQEKGLKVIPRAFNKSLPGILPHLFRVFRSSHCHTYYGMTGLDHFIIQFFLVGGSPPQNFWSDGISTPFNWLCWLNPLQ